MKNLLAAFVVLGLSTVGVAMADDETKEDKKPETEDCSKLEGDAKTECESKKAEGKTEPKGGKGKSMQKSKDGNMEGFNEE